MRIIKIKIVNINSLKGEWVIDFSDPVFAENKNQFVIYGETGSGKTTILDAISLACFGKTARLDNLLVKFNQAEALNEIMTRKTAYSEATVVYECKKGLFESSFIMKKTRGSTDGKLSFEFSIKDLSSGEFVCPTITKLKGIEEETKKITSLSYLQFTRSMILAQGQFAKFIEATEEERAQIMDAISGTDYASMGQRISGKAKNEIRKYEDKQKSLQQINVLDEEKEEELKAEQNGIPEKREALQKASDDNNSDLTWLDQLKAFQKALEAAEEERKNYEAEAAEFALEEKKLEKAEKAASCEVPYSIWFSLKSQQDNDKEKLLVQKTELEKIKVLSDELAVKQKKLENEVQEKEREEKDFSLLWKKVRAILLKKQNAELKLDECAERKNDAQKKFDAEKKKKEEAQANLLFMQESFHEAGKYLEEHSGDEVLPELIPVLKEKVKNAEESFSLAAEAERNIKVLEINIVEVKKQLDDLFENKNQAEKKLEEFISSEYKLVSSLIRTSLENGKPCPVCGSESHPLCKEDGNEKFSDEKVMAAEKISGLSKAIENAEKEITENQKKREIFENQLSAEQVTLKKHRDRILELQKEVNKTLFKWNMETDFSEGTEGFGNCLVELQKILDTFLKEKKSYDELKNNIALTEKEISGIDLTGCEQTLKKETDKFLCQEKECLEIQNELKETGDGKYNCENDVTEEENNFNSAFEKIKEMLKDISGAFVEAEKKKSGTDSVIKELSEAIEARETELFEALKNLKESLSENGFSEISDFEENRLPEDEIKGLKKSRENLKAYDADTKAEIKTAEKNLKAHTKTEPAAVKKLSEDKSFMEIARILSERKTKFEKELFEISERFGEINRTLQENENCKADGIKIRHELETMKPEYERWKKIRDMIGRDDGEKFRVFVQVLFFRNLIKKANKYFTGILPEYSLVQVKDKVDFKIHSTSFNDAKDDRDCGNMSGGEKFIISLSFALGISELSSRSVSIDSLFLDEGFGTLSGEPLIQSVAALKKLQSAGKTLGIITHVSEVIKEFDLKIEAKAVKGVSGYSELNGPGITRIS